MRAVCRERRLVELDGPDVGALRAEDRLASVSSAVATVRNGGGVLLITDIDALLPATAEPVATLILTGTNSTTATGNALSNRLDGSQNTAANTLIGGFGDDVYVVEASDLIVEAEGEGIDTVEADFNYTLQSNVENVILRGTDAISATGNSGNNRLDGSQNSASNSLAGGLGDDTYVIAGVGSFYGEADIVVRPKDLERSEPVELLQKCGHRAPDLDVVRRLVRLPVHLRVVGCEPFVEGQRGRGEPDELVQLRPLR